MQIWFILIFILFLVAALEVIGGRGYCIVGNSKTVLVKQAEKKFATLSGLLYFYAAFFLAFLAVFSFKTGRDWEAYIQMFNNAESMLKHGSVERGYIWINHFFKKLGFSYWTLRSVLLIFCTFVMFRSFYKRSDFPCYTLALYFCLYYFATDFAQTRQYLAMAVLILGSDFIKRRKLLQWILLIALAMQFHITAICAFPLYFTDRFRIKTWFAFLALFGCLVMNLLGLDFIWGVMDLVSELGFVPERILRLLDFYRNSDEYNKQAEFSSGIGLIVRYSFYFLVVFLYYVKYRNKKIEEFCVLNFLIGVLFESMGRNFSQFSRIGNYYFLVGGGLFAYNILPKSVRFFKRLDFIRILFSVSWLLFIFLNLAI